MNEDFEKRLQEAIANPMNMGEMRDADAVGTVGNPDCGDMVRLWLKFKEDDGRKVIDKATFQSFGCQTAIAVASMATELLKGKTLEQARSLGSSDLAQPLGPLPPMKIHCGEMVEGALKAALEEESDKTSPASETPAASPTLLGNLSQPAPAKSRIKIVKLEP